MTDKMGRSKATWGARVVSRAARTRRLLVASVVLILIASLPAAAAPGQNANGRGTVRPSKLDIHLESQARQTTGETDVIIEFNDDKNALSTIEGFGNAGRKLGILKGYTARIPNHALARLAAHPSIKKVSFDRPAENFNGRTAITTGARVVQELSGYTGAGIGVAVIDSGITGWHGDLTSPQTYTYTVPKTTYTTDPLTGATIATVTYVEYAHTYYGGQRVAHFADFVNGYDYPNDGYGHGTHVAGVIAGNGYSSLGVRTAMAPGASIVALKALDDYGRGTVSGIIAALDYAVAIKELYNIRVINLSVGAGVYESYETDPLTLAAKRAIEAGIVVVAAAGNLGKAADGTPQYGAITAPGNAPWVLTVGASSTQGTTDRADDIIGLYSSRGPTMFDYAAKPDLVAPGTGTVSLSDPFGRLYVEKPHLLVAGAPELHSWFLPYISLTGTSMAAPAVAGTVALMLEANPNLTPNLVKAILQFTSQVYPGYNWLTQGAGFLNTRGAVRLAEYFAAATRGTPYPDMTGWSKHIFWGNYRVTGGVLSPGGTAWGLGVLWGGMQTPSGQHIVWGENCTTETCDNVVWGNSTVWGASTGGDNVVWGNTDVDNVVWGNGADDNVVWGNSDGDNVVWGNDCGGDDCNNVVWGNSGDDNVVWGNCEGDGCDNVVWGHSDGDNVVWGNADDDNVVWGNSAGEVVFGDDTADVNAFDSSVWDDLFRVTALVMSGGTN
jgi:serine protease AprX